MSESKWRAGTVERIAVVVVLVQISYWILTRLMNAVAESLYFRGFPADGPFQLFNPLRRIADGQSGGVDFQYFHGLGLPYLHYPLFALFGESIFASELSRHVVSFLFFLVPLFFFVRAFSPSSRATLFACSVSLALLSLPTALYYPDNAQMGVRSATPLLLAAAIATQMRLRNRVLVEGFLLAMSFLLSTEHGLALVVAYVGYRSLTLATGRTVSDLINLIVPMVIAGSCITIAYLAIGGWPAFTGALEYALRSVVLDQFWYFGVPPNPFLDSWKRVLLDPQISGVMPFALLMLILVLRLFLRSEEPEFRRRLGTLVLLTAYGIITFVSYLGMAYHGYLYPLKRVLTLVAIAVVLLNMRQIQTWLKERRGFEPTRSWYWLLLVIALFDIGVSSLFTYGQTMPQTVLVLHSESPRLSDRWRSDLDVGREVIGKRDNPVIWSTYAGLIEDSYDVFHPSHDYIIHALGPEERDDYLRRFRQTRPEFVQTVRRSLFRYEEWLQLTHWDFYEELLRNYDIAAVSSHSIWWQRRAAPRELESISIGEIPLESGRLTPVRIPSLGGRLGVLVVTLEYDVVNRWDSVPFVGSWPRYLFISQGSLNSIPTSLPPYHRVRQIPLFVRGDSIVGVGVETSSLIGEASVTVNSATAELIVLSPEIVPILTDWMAPVDPISRGLETK